MQLARNDCYLRAQNVYRCFLNERVTVQFMWRKEKGFWRWEKKDEWPKVPNRWQPVRESLSGASWWILSSCPCPAFHCCPSPTSVLCCNYFLLTLDLRQVWYTQSLDWWHLGNESEVALLRLEKKGRDVWILSRNSEQKARSCVLELLGRPLDLSPTVEGHCRSS